MSWRHVTGRPIRRKGDVSFKDATFLWNDPSGRGLYLDAIAAVAADDTSASSSGPHPESSRVTYVSPKFAAGAC